MNLIGEYHSLSYAPLTAHSAIVFSRLYDSDNGTESEPGSRLLRELLFFLVDEMEDITFLRALYTLMDAMIASLKESLVHNDVPLQTFVIDVEDRLPKYLQETFHPNAAMT